MYLSISWGKPGALLNFSQLPNFSGTTNFVRNMCDKVRKNHGRKCTCFVYNYSRSEDLSHKYNVVSIEFSPVARIAPI